MGPSKKPISIEMAIAKAETLCSRAEYSQTEILKKLMSWGIGHGDAKQIIDELIDNRFIDNERFARAFVAEKVEFARWGVKKIYMGLRAKGIDHATIKEALAGINAEKYYQNIIDLVKAKAKTLEEPTAYENRSKILRFMLSRGFEGATVAKVLNNRDLWVEE